MMEKKAKDLKIGYYRPCAPDQKEKR